MSSGAGHWINDNLGTVIAGAALLVTITTWLIDHQRRRRLVTYRIHMNAPITARPGELSRLGDFVVQTKTGEPVPLASMVLIRVANKGRVDVDNTDFDLGGAEFVFEGRTVRAVEPFEATTAKLLTALDPDKPGGITYGGEMLTLPKLNLNIDDRFKLLVLLSGAGRANPVGDTHIKGGKFTEEKGGSGPGRRTIGYGAVSVALAGALVAFALSTSSGSGGTGPVPAVTCQAGAITIEGSTAFYPSMTSIAGQYERACTGATITVMENGSVAGINALNNGTGTVDAAMYDGTAAPGAYPGLTGTPIGLVEFTVVVNAATGVYRLSTQQVQKIFSLQYTNWDQLGGRSLPIRIVARDSESGTRLAFQNTMLGGQSEAPGNSPDCVAGTTTPSPAVLVCEMNSTGAVLGRVSAIQGAIGYAEYGQAKASSDVTELLIDGKTPDIQQPQNEAYPFWATEHIYTRGNPPVGSLLAAFIEYLTADDAKNVMETDGIVPCGNLPAARAQADCG